MNRYSAGVDSKSLVVLGGVIIALGFFSMLFFGGDPDVTLGTLDTRWLHSACFIAGVACFGAAYYMARRR